MGHHLLSIAICQRELGIGRGSTSIGVCISNTYERALKGYCTYGAFRVHTSSTTDGDIKNHTFAGEVEPDSLV